MKKYSFNDGINPARTMDADTYDLDVAGPHVFASFYGASYVQMLKHPMSGEDVPVERRDRLGSYFVAEGWLIEAEPEASIIDGIERFLAKEKS